MNVGANSFGTYKNKKVLITSNQSTDDIIKALQKYHKMYRPDYDKASEHFWKGDVKSTGQFLFDFLKRNVRYDVEPKDEQTIKTPVALLKQGYGDCKHMSSFVAGIADSLRRKGYPIEVLYRFASYKAGQEPKHVFAVLLDEDGQEYWVDPIDQIQRFDQRKQPVRFKDKSAGVAGMGDLYAISGMDAMAGKKRRARLAEKAKTNPKLASRLQKKATRKAEGKGFFRKAAGAVKKVSLAPSRNSFLLLLKMNLFRTASKLKAKMNADPSFRAKVDKKWKQLGGNPKQLHKDIERGVRVWNKHHKDKQISGTDASASDVMYGLNKYGWAYDSVYLDDVGFCVDCTGNHKINSLGMIGVVPAIGAGAIIAAAASIIAAFAPLLKGAGVDTNNMTAEAADAEQKMYDEEADDEDQEYLEQEEYSDNSTGIDPYVPEADDDEVYDYDDEEDMEDMSGLTAEDLQTGAGAASQLVSAFAAKGKKQPKPPGAGIQRRAAKRVAKGKPLTKRMVRKGVTPKAIPLKGKVLKTGVRVIEHGTPVWDKGVRASHGEPGGKKGLHVEQGPEGGQGVQDFFTQAYGWMKENPVPAAAGALGLLFATGMIGGKKKRR